VSGLLMRRVWLSIRNQREMRSVNAMGKVSDKQFIHLFFPYFKITRLKNVE